MKKYRILIISIFVLALSIGTVFAGGDIRTAADKYFKSYCTDAKPPLTGQRAFLCDMRMRLDYTTNQVSDINKRNFAVGVTDVSGNKLGIFLGMIDNPEYANTVRLFIPLINRWIPINGTTGHYAFNSDKESNAVYFSEKYCLGQAYVTHSLGTQSVDRVINTSAIDSSQPQNNRFFKVENPIPSSDPILLHSKLYNASCSDIGEAYLNGATASEIQLPFTLPVATPMLLKSN